MKNELLTVPSGCAGQRLDAFVGGQIDGMTRSMAQRLIEDGAVTVDNAPGRKNQRLSGGESIAVRVPDPRPIDAEPQDIPLDIMFEDDCVIVINKPRGMVVHPAPGSPDGTLVNALLAYCGDSLSGIGGAQRPGIVHRLDKDTSGLMIVAKNDESHLSLSKQLKDRTLTRVYEAVVRGSLRDDSGTIVAPIGRSAKDRKKMAVRDDGREAVTEYQVLARYPGYTHVRCRLKTGRTHQIRVHMASIGHPLAGDPLYGDRGDRSGISGQCLHAREIMFIHPRNGYEVKLSCRLPQYFSDFIDKLEGR